MYVLGISGSPKQDGFTELLLNKALDGAASTGAQVEKIILNDMDFKACQECGGCDEAGVCALDDDMKPLYKKLSDADAVVAASPIYFGNVTAQLKAMIDRCHSSWVAGHILKKDLSLNKKRKGLFICVSGRDDKGRFEDAKKVIKIFFLVNNIKYAADLFVPGLDRLPLDDPKRKIALDNAFKLGADLTR